LIAFFSFYWNTKENVALDVCFIANNIESASQAFYKSLWKEWIYYNVSTNELILEVFENICKHIETDFLVEIEKLEKNPIKGEIVLLIEPQEKEQRGGNKYVNDTD